MTEKIAWLSVPNVSQRLADVEVESKEHALHGILKPWMTCYLRIYQ